MNVDAKELFEKIKSKVVHYNEDEHCLLLLKTMMNREEGTVESFCVKLPISDRTFLNWIKKHELFAEVYCIAKLFARREWEREGRELREQEVPMGMTNNAFEYWKMIGWSRFGISKNSRIKLELDPDATPDQHYAQLLRQAADGHFTAAEIKQLMEAINVGLNTHQVIKLQKEIDQLKSDLLTMESNTDVHNSGANKRIA